MGAAVSTKALEQFDAALKDSETTKRLVVRDCELLVLPPKDLERTIHLRELRLEHAKLKQLPASFGCLLLLERLSLSNNHLETLPLSFHKFQRLEELDLSCNKLRSLLGNFCNLGALRRLFMYDNALKKLPREFGALSSLEMLDVHNNRLWKLPKSFPCLAKLTRVDFSRNKLRKLPEAFGNLSALRICSLGRNVLSELPPFFGMLGSLEVLTLSYNALYKLPASFVDLISLTNLSLTGNRIESFPGPQFSGLKTLVTLTYSENRLRQWQPGEKIFVLEDDIPDNEQVIEEDVDGEVDELSNVFSNPLSPLENIQYLDLSDNALIVLPRQGWNRLTVLVHLKLSRNRLQKLPSEIGKLPKLQRLDIAANKLEFLPLTLFSTKTLAFLDAHQNSLQTLPDNVGECEALVRLVLTKNRELHGLPSSFCCLSRLEELRVDKACFLALDDAVTAFCRKLAFFSAE
ncbi:putative LRR protein [Phytophthora megakarya]|uniref:Putative LRR protein n=1 Tax=Phytophthora megakarya TaxID=4795 RepID=A0A225W940_9STRA|nr:putative LRR protein [Phytophthora megakarya]